MWLWLAYEIQQRWAWASAIVIAAAVGLSRIYLGVHDVEDVTGGALLGLATFVIYRSLVSDQFKAWHDLNPEIQLLAIAALGPLLWMIWPAASVPIGIFALVVFLFSWWLGRMIEERWVKYERHENWIFAAAAAVAGIAVLFALYTAIGPGLGAAGFSKLTALSLQFGLIALYVTAIAPALFRLSRLAW
jgi:hypothetical protein